MRALKHLRVPFLPVRVLANIMRVHANLMRVSFLPVRVLANNIMRCMLANLMRVYFCK